MTPEERAAYMEHLDKVIRTRNTWDDMRALDAYLSLWEMAYGPARLAVQVSAAARAVVEQEEPGTPTDQLDRDLDVLARVGRMYLDALDSDPENEMLTLPEAMLVTEVRAAVERREASWEPAEQPEPAPTLERISPETIASALAVVDAPYRPDVPVRYLDADEPEPARGGTLPASDQPLVAEDGCTLTRPSKRRRMTDGCGPQHTFTGSCELADWGGAR